MEEKAGKPKRPDNSLPLIYSLITRTIQQNQVSKNKQTNMTTTTRHGTMLKHKSINCNLKLAFVSIDFIKCLMDFEALSEFSKAFQRQEPLVRTE